MGQKIIFANQLRGVAAILVVISHLIGVFYGGQEIIASATFTPNLHLTAPEWIQYLYVFSPKFNYGAFGVAIFFLISGFIISFSLKRYTPGTFFIGRLLRIYPTYWACLGLSLLFLYLNTRYWQTDFTHGKKIIGLNMLLVHNLFGMPSIDLVNWTLSIEMKFYIIMAIMGTSLISNQFTNIVIFALFTLVFAIAYPQLNHSSLQSWQPFMMTLLMELNFVLFMFIGTIFYLHFTQKITTTELIIRITFLLLVFSIGWSLGPIKEQFFGITRNYYFGLIVFATAYQLRNYFKPNALLDFFANISYSLYLIHSLIGYSLLKFLINQSISFEISLLVSSILILIFAYLVHIWIEKPSIIVFKKFFAH